MMTTSAPAPLTSLALAALLGLTPSPAAQGTEHHKLLASDGQAGDEFGSSVATDGTRVAVGAPQADDQGASSGSAYVFGVLSGAQRLELVPLNGSAGDRFGTSIAAAEERVVVGAPYADGAGTDAGTAYVFDATTGLQLLELQPTDAAAGALFGVAVAVDGGLAVVGTSGQGAYLFDLATGQQLEKLVPDAGLPIGGTPPALIDGGFGKAVAIDAQAGRIVVGAPTANGEFMGGPYLYSGTAYVFDFEGDERLQLSSSTWISAWSFFGASVDIDGGSIVVGSAYADPNGKESGIAFLFDATSGQQTEQFIPSDGHVFQRFGASVAIDGQHVVVGANQDNGGGLFSAGSVYLYEEASGSLVTKLTASDATALDELGGAVAVDRGVLVAGAIRDDDNGESSGSAYLFAAAGAVTDMAACQVNLGTLTHVEGLAVAGQTLVLRMDTAQPASTLAMLALSRAPVPGWPSCGVPFNGAGELLIDLSAANLVRTVSRPWTGSAADFPMEIPVQLGLAGLRGYLQGAFLAPAGVEPLRLTGGLEIELGGYM